jgi:hypothetical protein
MRWTQQGVSYLVVVIAILVVFAAGVAAIAFWSGYWPMDGRVRGSGQLDTRAMDVTAFTAVEVGWAFTVTVEQADAFSVDITAEDNLFDYIVVDQTGDTVTIGLAPGYSYNHAAMTLRAVVTLPRLEELALSGASSGTLRGFHASNPLSLDVSGASTLTGGVTASGTAQFRVSGASTLELTGSAQDGVFDIDGASTVRLGAYPLLNANVTLGGASHATINLSGQLNADVSGASHLTYLGDPTLGDIVTSGGSTVTG